MQACFVIAILSLKPNRLCGCLVSARSIGPLFLHNLKHIPELDTAQPTPPSRKPHGLLSSISGNTARRWSRQAHKEKIAGSPSVIHVERRHPIAPARGHPAFDEGTCGGGLITRIGVSLV